MRTFTKRSITFLLILFLGISCTKDAVDPTVTTLAVTEITSNTAKGGGNVTGVETEDINSRGIVWSTTGSPTVQQFTGITTEMAGTGLFTSLMTGLLPNTTYYVIAYATTKSGTFYGNQVQFTTSGEMPTVTTSSVSDITINSATCGGNVISDGGATITARGVCWSTSPNPTLSGNHTTDGSGVGQFTSNITGLSLGNTYYVRAYATNSQGTSYGNEEYFTTLSWQCGDTFTDERDGHIYTTVLIGTQCWMKQNLNVGTRISGSNEQTNNGTIEKYCYDNSNSNCNTYGGLYQWDEMMQYSTNEGVKGVCPDEWHLPTDAEWTTLTDYLGGEDVAGGKMKEAGTTHWAYPNEVATNSSGFTALPGGNGYPDGSFINMSYHGCWWSSSQYNATYAWFRKLYYSLAQVYRDYDEGKSNGFSVRCLKDN